MTIAAWVAVGVSILTLIVTTLVNIGISAANRKQMRQIELHRADPTVPLVPPPHPATKFFRRHSTLILSLAWNMGYLGYEMSRTGPVTRGQVLAISLAVGSTLYLIISSEITSVFEKALQVDTHSFSVLASVIDKYIAKDK